jgi:hypothetical protein
VFVLHRLLVTTYRYLAAFSLSGERLLDLREREREREIEMREREMDKIYGWCVINLWNFTYPMAHISLPW